jgi:hypothetical protein
MIEEMLHRNALFCARHAEEIADVTIEEPEVTDLGDGLYRVTVDLVNPSIMPSRSALAADHKIGTPDRVTLSGAHVQVVVGGTLDNRFHPERMQPQVTTPETVRLEAGVPGQGRQTVTWLVRGSGDFQISYAAEKSTDSSIGGTL